VELTVLTLIEARLKNIKIKKESRFSPQIIREMMFILRSHVPTKNIPHTQRPIDVRGKVIEEIDRDVTKFSQQRCIDKWTRMDSRVRKHMPDAFYNILGLFV